MTATVIRASAGSGKTYRLAVEYIRTLVEGSSPSHVLATTFTKKAAGEILGRVLMRLAVASLATEAAAQLESDLNSGKRLTTHDAGKHLVTLRDEMQHLSISTLDSFFYSLLRCHQVELGMAGVVNVETDDSDAIRNLRLSAIEPLLAGDHREATLHAIQEIIPDKAPVGVVSEIDQRVAVLHGLFRSVTADCWTFDEPATTFSNTDSAQLIAAAQTAARSAKPAHQSKVVADLQKAATGDWPAFVKTGIGSKVASAIVQHYDLQIGMGAVPTFPSAADLDDIKFGAGKDNVVRPDIVAAYLNLLELARAKFQEALVNALKAVYQLLALYDDQLRAMPPGKAVTFSEIPLLLSELDDAHRLAATDRLGKPIAHLLLDEFQDTSPVQWRLMRPFAAASLNAVPAGSVFIVGDVKQSIYGWRNASPEIFDSLDTQIGPIAHQSLSTSYRSSPVVLRFVDTLYFNLRVAPPERIAQGARSFLQGYEEHHAYRDDLPGYASVWRMPHQNDDQDDTAWFARHVQDVVGRNPAATVGVLARSNKTVAALISKLRALGVACSGEGGMTIDHEPPAAIILSCLILADHPEDTASAFRVLHSPLGARMFGDKGVNSQATVKDVAADIRRQLVLHGLPDVVSAWARELAPHTDENGAARLVQLCELAEEFAGKAAEISPRGFVDFVRRTRVEEPSPARVRVMSIHQSKGLEFDIVIVLVKAREPFSRGDGALLINRKQNGDPDQIYFGVFDLQRLLLPEAYAAYKNDQARQVRESLAVLYVAVTRAKQELRVLVAGKPQQNTVGRLILDMIDSGEIDRDDDVDADLGELAYEDGDANWKLVGEKPETLEAADTVQRSWPGTVRKFPRRILPSQIVETMPASNLIKLRPRGRQEAMDTGEIYHAFCECVQWSGVGAWPDDSDLILSARRRHLLVGDGGVETEIATWRQWISAPAVVAALRKPTQALASVPLSDPGETSAPYTVELWRERRFAVHAGGDLIEGVFDRVVVERLRGVVTKVTLIDYKADHVTGDGSETAARYRNQVDAYVRALEALLKVDRSKIDAMLVLLSAGLVVTMA